MILASVSSLSLPFCPLCFPFSFYIIMWERPLCFCFGSPASDFAFWIWESPTMGDLGGMWNLLESEGARNLLPLAAWVWLTCGLDAAHCPFLPRTFYLGWTDQRPEACAVGCPVIGVVSGPEEMLLNEVATLPSSWFPKPPLIFAYFSRLSLASCSWWASQYSCRTFLILGKIVIVEFSCFQPQTLEVTPSCLWLEGVILSPFLLRQNPEQTPPPGGPPCCTHMELPLLCAPVAEFLHLWFFPGTVSYSRAWAASHCWLLCVLHLAWHREGDPYMD